MMHFASSAAKEALSVVASMAIKAVRITGIQLILKYSFFGSAPVTQPISGPISLRSGHAQFLRPAERRAAWQSPAAWSGNDRTPPPGPTCDGYQNPGPSALP